MGWVLLIGAGVIGGLILGVAVLAVVAKLLLWLLILPFRLLFWLIALPLLAVKAVIFSVGALLFAFLLLAGAAVVGVGVLVGVVLPILPILALAFCVWVVLRAIRPATA